MSERRIRYCRECGVEETPENPLSQRAMCTPCARELAVESQLQLRYKEGPMYAVWVESQLAAANRRVRQLRAERQRLKLKADGAKMS